MMGWAEQAGKEKIAALWKAGMSMLQIAEETGAPSRSAVAGYIHREGLERPEHLPKRRTTVRKQRRRAWSMAAKTAPRPPRRKSGPLTIMELSDVTCRYPLGAPKEPATLYCGEPAVPGAPYCASHCEVCYAPTSSGLGRRAA